MYVMILMIINVKSCIKFSFMSALSVLSQNSVRNSVKTDSDTPVRTKQSLYHMSHSATITIPHYNPVSHDLVFRWGEHKGYQGAKWCCCGGVSEQCALPWDQWASYLYQREHGGNQDMCCNDTGEDKVSGRSLFIFH